MENLLELVQLSPDTKTEFVNKKNSDVVCQRCFCVLPRLERSPCGHGFCATCLQDLPSGIVRCPVDGIMFLKTEMVLDEILKAEVFCTNKVDGCDKVTRLDELKNHLRDCPYTTIRCPQGCSVLVSRKALVEHIIQLCSRRSDNCIYCLEELPHEVKLEHEDNCPRKPQSCVHCRKNPIPASELQNHYKECSLIPRDCIAQSLGCSYKGTKDQVTSHKNSWPEHSDSVIRTLTSVKTKLEKHEQVHDQVINQLTGLIDNMEKWKTNIENEQKDFQRREQVLRKDVENMKADLEYLKRHVHEYHIPSGTVLYLKKTSKNKIEAYTVGVATEHMRTSQALTLTENVHPAAPVRGTSARQAARRSYFRQEGSSSFVERSE